MGCDIVSNISLVEYPKIKQAYHDGERARKFLVTCKYHLPKPPPPSLYTPEMWQDQQQQQGGGGYAGSSYYQPAQESLQFYSPGGQDSGFYPGSRPSLDGQPIQGSMTPQPGAGGYGGSIQGVQPWWTAFGTGGLEGEPPLLDGTSSVQRAVKDHPQLTR